MKSHKLTQLVTKNLLLTPSFTTAIINYEDDVDRDIKLEMRRRPQQCGDVWATGIESHREQLCVYRESHWKSQHGLHTVQGGAKKRGHVPISLQIFWKFHDRIAWKLVKFCNIICWTQSLTFLFKNFIALWRHLAKTQLLCDAQIYFYSVNKRQ